MQGRIIGIPFLMILQLLTSTSVMALETDNYLMWNRELSDSSEKINHFLFEEIQQALKTVNRKTKPQDCTDVVEQVARRFMSFYINKNPIENWLIENLNEDEIYPRTGNYVKDSIYRNPFRFYTASFGLSPNVQVNHVYFGTDKLTHFTSTGRRYFNHYLKMIKDGFSEKEALRSSTRFGLRNEASLLGYWASGVFSYSDVEANFQGLLFYKKLCLDQNETYLQKNKKDKWFLINRPDIRDYVSPFWDETFYLPYRLPENWKKVSPVIRELYCPLINSKEVVNRMDYYREYTHSSFSLEYIKELQLNGYKDAPIPEDSQSITLLCDQ